ncbi:MAG: hypothetical protein JWM59_4485 [Verrucomicrobiales bacterium]|nr:hypothetical protein [Verrucomicrobiales bacterium]
MSHNEAVNLQHGILNPVTGSPVLSGWRRDAARLAAELLCRVSPAAADEVLDLRSSLLNTGMTPGGLLRAFFAARNRLESEHYLLFFRLRRVMEPALGVEVSTAAGHHVRSAVDFRYCDPRQLVHALRRERFEHDLTVDRPEEVTVRFVWRFESESSSLLPQN